jgi:hypothetical protein
MRAAIRTEHAARAAIADTLQARAAQLQAFRSIKPAPVRAVRRARADLAPMVWCMVFGALAPAVGLFAALGPF